MTRNPSTEPAAAYERHIALVRAIAFSDPVNALKALCEQWGVDPSLDTSLSHYGVVTLNKYETIRALAQHAIAYHRAEDEQEAAPLPPPDDGPSRIKR